MNLLQIIAEIAKLKPMTGVSPAVTIARWKGGEKWREFSKKAVLWIFMAQNFTFRLSTLVQVLLDFEQKRDFNNEDAKAFKYRPCQVNTVNEGNMISGEEGEVENVDTWSIFEFYQRHVEKFIHILRHSERLSRVDKDPEEFAFLLLKCDAIGIKCEDILGPRIQPNDDDKSLEGERRKDFSLLSYSFNLDSAMRREIGDDMAGFVTEHEMFDKNGVVALQKGHMVRKKHLLSKPLQMFQMAIDSNTW